MKNVAIFGVCFALLGGFVFWRLSKAEAPPFHVAVVVDLSESTTACASLSTITEVLPTEHRVRSSSRLFLIATGTRKNPHGRHLLTMPVPHSISAMEGRQRQADRLAKFTRHVARACGDASASDTSPIWRAIGDAVDQLRTSGCNSGPCRLIAITDGLENVDGSATPSRSKPRADPQFQIDNTLIEITICGLAETREAANGVPEFLKKWFLYPETVKVAPFCDATVIRAN